MRANYRVHPDPKRDPLNVVSMTADLEITADTPQCGLEFMSAFAGEVEPSVHVAIINLSLLKMLLVEHGKIWAIKYVRAQTISLRCPGGCSLLTAKNFVESVLPLWQIDYDQSSERRDVTNKLYADWQRRTADHDPRD